MRTISWRKMSFQPITAQEAEEPFLPSRLGKICQGVNIFTATDWSSGQKRQKIGIIRAISVGTEFATCLVDQGPSSEIRPGK